MDIVPFILLTFNSRFVMRWVWGGLILLIPVVNFLPLGYLTKTSNLLMIGGIDKRALAKGKDAIHREVDRVIPLVEDGGYLPELDHSVPPDVSWPDFCEYVEYLEFRLGRG